MSSYAIYIHMHTNDSMSHRICSGPLACRGTSCFKGCRCEVAAYPTLGSSFRPSAWCRYPGAASHYRGQDRTVAADFLECSRFEPLVGIVQHLVPKVVVVKLLLNLRGELLCVMFEQHSGLASKTGPPVSLWTSSCCQCSCSLPEASSIQPVSCLPGC